MSTFLQRVKRVLYKYPPIYSVNHSINKLFRREGLANFDVDRPCIFVLSTGRVGTETLAQLYGLSKKVYTHHEPPPNLDVLSKLVYENIEIDEKFDAILCEAFRVSREVLMQASLRANRGYIETSHYTSFLAPAIKQLLPQAYFLYVYRHPYDFVISTMKRKWYDGNENDKGRITPRVDSPHYAKWQNYSVFQKNVWLWAATNQWILDFVEEIPDQQKLSVAAEDIFAADEKILRNLFEFSELPVPSNQQLTNILKKKLNSQKTGEFPTPKDWSQEMLAQFQKIAGATAHQLGYKL